MSDKDRSVIWKRIALCEFILLLIGLALGILYWNIRNGIILRELKDFIGLFVNVGVLCLFLIGGSGWIVLISLWEEEHGKTVGGGDNSDLSDNSVHNGGVK